MKKPANVRSHFEHVFELFLHVAQRELSLRHAFDHLGLIAHVRVLHLFDEARQVAHAEQTRDEGAHVERLEIVNVFAGADKDDGRFGGRDLGDRRPETNGREWEQSHTNQTRHDVRYPWMKNEITE